MDDLLSPFTEPQPVPSKHHVAISAAGTLQRTWRSRFEEKYFEMDELRYAAMLSTGSLGDVSFSTAPPDRIALWRAEESEPVSELEGGLQVAVGQRVQSSWER